MDISDAADQCQNPSVDTIIRCSVCDRNLTGIEDVHSVDKDELGIRIEEGLLKSSSPKLTFKIPFVDHQVRHFLKHFSVSFYYIFCLQGQINFRKIKAGAVEPKMALLILKTVSCGKKYS